MNANERYYHFIVFPGKNPNILYYTFGGQRDEQKYRC